MVTAPAPAPETVPDAVLSSEIERFLYLEAELLDAWRQCGERRLVGGQEDMVIDSALRLAGAGARSALRTTKT